VESIAVTETLVSFYQEAILHGKKMGSKFCQTVWI
jgi:hypothetical protein